MGAKVLRACTDREGGGVYMPGDEFPGSAARVAELAGAGYVEKPKAKARAKAKPKPEAAEE